MATAAAPEVPSFTRKMREALLPLTVSAPEPGPLIVTERTTGNCPVVSVMVPVNPGWNTMVSFSTVVPLESAIACRRLPRPASFRFVTVKVAGTVRSSNRSTAKRHAEFRFALQNGVLRDGE